MERGIAVVHAGLKASLEGLECAAEIRDELRCLRRAGLISEHGIGGIDTRVARRAVECEGSADGGARERKAGEDADARRESESQADCAGVARSLGGGPQSA